MQSAWNIPHDPVAVCEGYMKSYRTIGILRPQYAVKILDTLVGPSLKSAPSGPPG